MTVTGSLTQGICLSSIWGHKRTKWGRGRAPVFDFGWRSSMGLAGTWREICNSCRRAEGGRRVADARYFPQALLWLQFLFYCEGAVRSLASSCEDPIKASPYEVFWDVIIICQELARLWKNVLRENNNTPKAPDISTGSSWDQRCEPTVLVSEWQWLPTYVNEGTLRPSQ
jgi:hypothetical protein